MKVTALGTSGGGVPRPGEAGTGYLFESGDTTLLVDIGNGVMGHLARFAGFDELDALVVSHWHFDHVSDLMALLLARTRSGPLPTRAPRGFGERVRTWAETFSGSPDLYLDRLDLAPYDPGDGFAVGDLEVTTVPVDHGPPTSALRIAAGDGTVTFSADTRWCDGLVEAARGADLLLCEATFPADPEYDELRATHLSGEEAGRAAAKADVDRLVLTHLVHHVDPAVLVAEAESVFDGPVEVAGTGGTWTV